MLITLWQVLVYRSIAKFMDYFVKIYLVLLALSALIILGLLVLRVWKRRSLESNNGIHPGAGGVRNQEHVIPLERTLFVREVFHILVGVILFVLFSEAFIGVATTLALSALLLIGFEYALMILKKTS
jgi:hypothetical protein